jgi:2-C-methyl-D-erythritol 4-phosphate cytidylyltransferase
VGGATVAVLVAAGAGERLGADEPKAFVLLAGEPLLVHAARGLCGCDAVDELVVVVPGGHEDRAGRALADAGLPSDRVCTGGPSRQASVAAGLRACPAATAIVAVHDAARALVAPELVGRTLAALDGSWAAVAPALPVVDTLKLVDATDHRVLRTVDRRGLWAVQTPQVFHHGILVGAHAAAGEAPATDDLALVEAAGGRVRVLEGDTRNFKITTPDDLLVAQALLGGHG